MKKMMPGRLDRRLVPLAALLIGAASVLGCGDSGGNSSVTGVVTFEGSPVTKGKITFHPPQGARASVGRIGADGSYSLSTRETGDGAPPGEYIVTITATERTGGGDDIMATGPPAKTTYLVPKKFSSITESGLTATVEPGSNTIDFNLP